MSDSTVVVPNPETQFMGNPCKYGHSGLRWRASNTCVECMSLWRDNKRFDPHWRQKTNELSRKRKHEKYADPSWIERERRRQRELHRLRALERDVKRDKYGLLDKQLCALVALATKGATKHEREAARAVLRKKGLL